MQNITEIYFICLSEICLEKIGMSNNIKKRLKTIKSIFSYEITLLSTVIAHKPYFDFKTGYFKPNITE